MHGVNLISYFVSKKKIDLEDTSTEIVFMHLPFIFKTSYISLIGRPSLSIGNSHCQSIEKKTFIYCQTRRSEQKKTFQKFAILTMKMADGSIIIRRNRPGTKAKVWKNPIIKIIPTQQRNCYQFHILVFQISIARCEKSTFISCMFWLRLLTTICECNGSRKLLMSIN